MDSTAFVRSAGVTQLVECNLAKVDVAGSNPVSRSSRKSFNPHKQFPGTNTEGLAFVLLTVI
jgi:hypothetical protein